MGKKDDIELLTKLWSAKESIFKALGKEGVSFSNDIEIDTINDKDLFRTGYYKKDNIKIKFDLDFICMEEYIICYAKKSKLMNQIFDFLFSQYSSYSPSFIYLELFAVIMNITSVVYAKRNNILVYPTGLIGTGIFVYILLNFSLLGDTIINAYFFSMSIYGWYFWSRKKDEVFINQVSTINRNEIKYLFILAFSSLIFIYFVYDYFDKWNNWTAYVDNITTAIFFVAMWLMARRKIESWIFWIIGDLITVPLYFYKGLTISSIQYIIFLILAVLGYISWKKILDKNHQKLKE